MLKPTPDWRSYKLACVCGRVANDGSSRHEYIIIISPQSDHNPQCMQHTPCSQADPPGLGCQVWEGTLSTVTTMLIACEDDFERMQPTKRYITVAKRRGQK